MNNRRFSTASFLSTDGTVESSLSDSLSGLESMSTRTSSTFLSQSEGVDSETQLVPNPHWRLRFEEEDMENSFQAKCSGRFEKRIFFILGVCFPVFIASNIPVLLWLLTYDSIAHPTVLTFLIIFLTHSRSSFAFILFYFAVSFVPPVSTLFKKQELLKFRKLINLATNTITIYHALALQVYTAAWTADVRHPFSHLVRYPFSLFVLFCYISFISFRVFFALGSLLFGYILYLFTFYYFYHRPPHDLLENTFPSKLVEDWGNWLSNLVFFAIVAYFREFQERKLFHFVRELEIVEQEFRRRVKDTRMLVRDLLPEKYVMRLEQLLFDSEHRKAVGSVMFREEIPECLVMQTDIVNFSAFSRKKPAMTIVELLNQHYYVLEVCSGSWNMTKLTTVGDSYVCFRDISGEDHKNACIDVCLFALECWDRLITSEYEGLSDLPIRSGAALGSFSVFLMGNRRFVFDGVGEALEKAKLLEQNGKAGALHVCPAIAELVTKEFRTITSSNESGADDGLLASDSIKSISISSFKGTFIDLRCCFNEHPVVMERDLMSIRLEGLSTCSSSGTNTTTTTFASTDSGHSSDGGVDRNRSSNTSSKETPPKGREGCMERIMKSSAVQSVKKLHTTCDKKAQQRAFLNFFQQNEVVSVAILKIFVALQLVEFAVHIALHSSFREVAVVHFGISCSFYVLFIIFSVIHHLLSARKQLMLSSINFVVLFLCNLSVCLSGVGYLISLRFAHFEKGTLGKSAIVIAMLISDFILPFLPAISLPVSIVIGCSCSFVLASIGSPSFYSDISSVQISKIGGSFLSTLCSTAIAFVGIGFEKTQHNWNLFTQSENLKRRTHRRGVETKRNEKLMISIMPREIIPSYLASVNKRRLFSARVDFAGICFVECLTFNEMFFSRSTNMTIMEEDKLKSLNILSSIFGILDNCCRNNKCCKIKSTGSTYFCVSNITLQPDTISMRDEDYQKRHAVNSIMDFCSDAVDVIPRFNEDLKVDFRIGVHLGPLCCAILGKTNRRFDCFGSPVNFCYRLLENCRKNCIHASKDVIKLLGDVSVISFEPMDNIEFKGFGARETYISAPFNDFVKYVGIDSKEH